MDNAAAFSFIKLYKVNSTTTFKNDYLNPARAAFNQLQPSHWCKNKLFKNLCGVTLKLAISYWGCSEDNAARVEEKDWHFDDVSFGCQISMIRLFDFNSGVLKYDSARANLF